jgi:peptidoglycan hydrolase CwlO-like protein
MKEQHLKIIFGIIIALLFYNTFFVSCSNRNRDNQIIKNTDTLNSLIAKQSISIDSLNKRVEYLQKDIELYNLQYIITKQSVNNKDVTIEQLNKLIDKKEQLIKQIKTTNESKQ